MLTLTPERFQPAVMPHTLTPRACQILTVNLEDYFQVGAFNRYVQRGQWYRFESRLPVHAERTLDLLDRYQAKATFFVLGWLADHYPDIIRQVADRGHEIASRGYYHRHIHQLTPEEFRKDLARARVALERVCGRRVVGYRAADGWFGPEDLWALDVLREEGYAYDSSLAPIGRSYAAEPWRRYLHEHGSGEPPLLEVPISSIRIAGQDLPIGGGNWLRQLPRWMMRRAIRRWSNSAPAPLVMYFHTWELDTEQPRLSSAGLLTRIRHYRNLQTMEQRLAEYLERYQFLGIAESLKIDRPPVQVEQDINTTPAPRSTAMAPREMAEPRTPISVVVPLYNEELIIPYLSNTLNKVREAFAPQYELQFILVDDGSKDRTWPALREWFGTKDDIQLVRHDGNRGVAAAIMTGIQHAQTEIVCSMDADCTYDPHELLAMIPKLQDGVDMVTASPYHPLGMVRNVPRWRLLLSKSASRMYRMVLRNQLYTYTSCFRVYRRSAVADLQIQHGNFLGVVELFSLLDARGSLIAEHPATLEVRMLGRSKMKTLRTILGHLQLMGGIARRRLLGSSLHPTPASAETLLHALASAEAATREDQSRLRKHSQGMDTLSELVLQDDTQTDAMDGAEDAGLAVSPRRS